MRCVYCDKEVKKETNFCPYCGNMMRVYKKEYGNNKNANDSARKSMSKAKNHTDSKKIIISSIFVCIALFCGIIFFNKSRYRECEECGQYEKCNKFVCDEGITHYYCDYCIQLHKLSHYC